MIKPQNIAKISTSPRCGWWAISAALVMWAAGVSSASAQTLLNGNFSLGNVDFAVDAGYTYITPAASEAAAPSATMPGQYGVGTDPADYSMSWASFGDHTSGTGNFLIVDTVTAVGEYAWQENVTGLTIGTQYTFSGYVATLVTESAAGHPMLQLGVNGTAVGTILDLSTTPGSFVPISVTFTATSISEPLEVYNQSATRITNDFGVDDLKVVAVPEPATAALAALGLGGLALAYRRRRAQAAH